MVRVFVRHRVEDCQAWRKVYDEFDQQRRSMGVKDDAVFQEINDPNDVTLWHDFDTPEAAEAFATSDELGDVMQRAGVDGEPEVWFVNPS